MRVRRCGVVRTVPVDFRVDAGPHAKARRRHCLCGIVGTYNRQELDLRAALRLIAHRGPDDEGTYGDGPVQLGMRRLNIIDLAGSRQPLSNEDGSVVIVFNGEIYNYQELRASLRARGHTLRTDGDTETIVHLYEEYGPACVHLLRGMFAFIIWDRRRDRLFAARDRMGKKPLYYHWDEGKLALASEIKSLRLIPGVGRAIDPTALALYLAHRYVPGPRTIYEGVSCLPAGHTLTLEGGRLQVERYWETVMADAYDMDTLEEAADGLSRLLDESVRLRMIADVPLGALLSGGIDSAAIVALMARHSPRPVQTFTVGFEGARRDDGWGYDETKDARALASYFGTDHHELHVSADAVGLLPRLMWHFDEPVADPAALPTFLISEFARRSVTVALSGEGADELLGGYPRYAWASRAQRAGAFVPPPLARLAVSSLTSSPRLHRLHRPASLMLTPLSPEERYVTWTGGATLAQRLALLTTRTRYESPWAEAAGTGTSIDDLMRADIATWLVDDVLMKVDKMSMAASLELRAPFLDQNIVAYVASLPTRFKKPNPATKPLLRLAMRGVLPEETRRRRKHAFAVPVGEWLRDALAEMAADYLFPASHEDHGLLDRAVLRALYDDHREGRADHAVVLWTVLCFEVWHREVFLQPTRSFEASARPAFSTV